MALRASRALQLGEAVTLDYGDRWLRKWLQSYGFTPGDCRQELFDEARPVRITRA